VKRFKPLIVADRLLYLKLRSGAAARIGTNPAARKKHQHAADQSERGYELKIISPRRPVIGLKGLCFRERVQLA